MSTLLEKPVKVNQIITTSMDHARAIDDPARTRILQILYHNTMSVEQITDELKKRGFKKALTTIRHHVDILKEAGLVQIVRIEETRGAITKFYGTSAKLYSYSIPKNFDSVYSKQIQKTTMKVERILKSIDPKPPKSKKDGQNSEYMQYLSMEIMNRAIANVIEKSRN